MSATSTDNETAFIMIHALRRALDVRAESTWDQCLGLVEMNRNSLQRSIATLDAERARFRVQLSAGAVQDAEHRAKLAQQAQTEKERADLAERELTRARAELSALKGALGDMLARVQAEAEASATR